MAGTDWLDRLFQVTTVFGRKGDVVATAGDYTADKITYDNGSSSLASTDAQAAIDELSTGLDTALASVAAETEISVSPASTEDNYSPTSWQDATHVIFSGTSTISGFAAPSAGKPKIKRFSTSGATAVTLSHESTSSSAANRVTVPQINTTSTASCTIRDTDAGWLVYSGAGSSGRWHVLIGVRPDKYSVSAVSVAGGSSNNDYNVSSLLAGTTMSFTGVAGAASFSGFVAPTASVRARTAPRVVYIASGPITFYHESASSSAVNRITVSTGLNWVAATGDVGLITYDVGSSRWHMYPMGIAASAAYAAYSGYTLASKFGAITLSNSATTPTDGHLLGRVGAEIAGVDPAYLSVDHANNASSASSASALAFGSGPSTNYYSEQLATPSEHDVISVEYEDNGVDPPYLALVGTPPGAIMPRMTPASDDVTAVTFTANRRVAFDGVSAAASFTVDLTGAIDGCTVTYEFAAGTLASIAFSTNIDPTGTLAYAFDSTSAAYVLILTYLSGIGCVVPVFLKVTDI